jgi:Tfp pilus assembly protein PilV
MRSHPIERIFGDTGPRREGEAGLGLLEVLVAMTVVVIATLALASSTASSFQAVGQSSLTTRVENAVRETVESIRTVNFNDLESLDGVQLFTNDSERNILIAIRVSQVSSTLKAIELEVFRKVRTGPNSVTPGDKIFQSLVYRAQR